MKHVIKLSLATASLALVVFSTPVQAQTIASTELPTPVLQALATAYPGVKDIAWNHDELSFEARFKYEGKRVELSLDDAGTVSETKKEIMECELPLDVSTLLVRQYCEWSVSRAFRVDNQGTGYYEAVIVKDLKTVTLVFENNGELLMTLIE